MNPDLKYCIYKDIVLKGNDILAIIEYEQGSFAVSLDLIFPRDIGPSGIILQSDMYFNKRNAVNILPKYEIEAAVKKHDLKQAEKKGAAEIEAEKIAQRAAQLREERMKELSLKYGSEIASKILTAKLKSA